MSTAASTSLGVRLSFYEVLRLSVTRPMATSSSGSISMTPLDVGAQ